MRINRLKYKTIFIVFILLLGFLTWRFIRPMNIFVVSEAFELPMQTQNAPTMFQSLRAEECAECHKAIYDEWSTTIHSQAWTDPYYQVDWVFDGSQQICHNCHIPLDRQQEYKVVGFHDVQKWDPILEPNPAFDSILQTQGVTCNACHLQNGKIVGVMGNTNAPHPVEKIDDPNQICVRCHVVSGDRWDTIFRFPPCGTVAEIQESRGKSLAKEITELGCVNCHMPVVERTVVAGGKTRSVKSHLWRGGHDPEMVKKGLTITFQKAPYAKNDNLSYILALTNTGAAHYFPTGTPDRHLTVHLRVLDSSKNGLTEKQHTLKRFVMWRPFIVDLWDTRLKPGQSREFIIEVPADGKYVEAEVRYHLLDEARRKRINYKNQDPINYSVYRRTLQVR